jgi:hypothetical protein
MGRKPKIAADWIAELRADYLSRGRAESSWTGDYLKILKRLPQDQPLTVQALRSVVEGTIAYSIGLCRGCDAIDRASSN